MYLISLIVKAWNAHSACTYRERLLPLPHRDAQLVPRLELRVAVLDE